VGAAIACGAGTIVGGTALGLGGGAAGGWLRDNVVYNADPSFWNPVQYRARMIAAVTPRLLEGTVLSATLGLLGIIGGTRAYTARVRNGFTEFMGWSPALAVVAGGIGFVLVAVAPWLPHPGVEALLILAFAAFIVGLVIVVTKPRALAPRGSGRRTSRLEPIIGRAAKGGPPERDDSSNP